MVLHLPEANELILYFIDTSDFKLSFPLCRQHMWKYIPVLWSRNLIAELSSARWTIDLLENDILADNYVTGFKAFSQQSNNLQVTDSVENEGEP